MIYQYRIFKKNILALFFLQIIACSANTPPSSAQANLNDVQNNWNQACITNLAQRNIITGYPDGSFRPNLSITRAEFAAIINKAFPNAPITRSALQFIDVPATYWANNAIRQATQTKFLSGYPGNVFQPNQNIPRVQVLVALTSGLNYSPASESTVLNATFDDANQIPEYARNGVTAATEKRLVVNYPNVRLLRPEKLATRAEVAAILCQALATTNQASLVPSQYIASVTTVGNTNEVFYPLAQQDIKSWSSIKFGMSASNLKEKFGDRLALSPVSDNNCLASGGINCDGVAQWTLKNFDVNKRSYDVTFQFEDNKLNTISLRKDLDAASDFVSFKNLFEKQYGSPTITDTSLAEIGLTRLIWSLPNTDIYLNKIETPRESTSMSLFYLQK